MFWSILMLFQCTILQTCEIVETLNHAFCEMSPEASGAWDSSAEELECTCHGSRFGADGSLITGPARSGVDSFPVSFDKDAGAGSVDVESVLAMGSAS